MLEHLFSYITYLLVFFIVRALFLCHFTKSDLICTLTHGKFIFGPKIEIPKMINVFG